MSDLDEGSGSDGEQESYRQQANLTSKKYGNKIHRLKCALSSKEIALKDLRAKIELKNDELRRLEKANRKLNQTLSEERSYYAKEKERFCSAMFESKRLSRGMEVGRSAVPSYSAVVPVKPSLSAADPITEGARAEKSSPTLSAAGVIRKYLSDLHDDSPQSKTNISETTALKIENKKLRTLVEDLDERNHELCVRYFRMKQCKELMWNRLRQVDEDFLNTLKILRETFDELRGDFNSLVERLKPASDIEEKYLKIAGDYYNLAYEHSSLKMDMQCLVQDIDNGLYGSRHRNKFKNKMTEENLKRAYPRDQSANSREFLRDVFTNSEFYKERTCGEGEEVAKRDATLQ